jgi:hypoxanthine phosphoribosyltransferase
VHSIMQRVQVKDKFFKIYIEEAKIMSAVEAVAAKINHELAAENPLFIAVLNGAFMYASDLMKAVTIPAEITFTRIASYTGMESSGNIKSLIGLSENIEGRTVVIIEDIVDTGNTIEFLTKQLLHSKVKDVKIATLLFKPNAYKKDIKVDYIGLEIPNDFVVGYGLDYDGQGRNLRSIYVLDQE